jgi:hypothetical protein
MSLVSIHDIRRDVDEFVRLCDDVGEISHQNISLFETLFRDTLDNLEESGREVSKKICTRSGCAFTFLNKMEEDKENVFEDLFTDSVSHNKTVQYLTYLFYIYLNNALQKAKIENYQYIFKGGTSYRAALISLYDLLDRTDSIDNFFEKYVFDESSENCMFKVSDFDSIVYLLYSGEPVNYMKQAEYVKQNILGALVRFKELLERDVIFKAYKRKLFKELTTEWKSEEFRLKLRKLLKEKYPRDEVEDKDIWVQLVDRSNMVIMKNPNNVNYGTVIDLTNPRTPFPRLSGRNYYSSRSPLYISSNEMLSYDTYLPSQETPDKYKFILNRMKINVVVHYGKRIIKAPAEFIDVAFPLYNDYGLRRYVKSEHYTHLNSLTPYELYKGTSDIDFTNDIDDIFRLLLGKSSTEVSTDRLKVLIYSPYLLFDDLVVTLLQKQYPWESKKLEKRIKRFLVMKILYQIIMKPDRSLQNSLRDSEKYIEQMVIFFEHGNFSKNEEVKRKFYGALESIHKQLLGVLSGIKINNSRRSLLQKFFVGGS